MNDKKRVISALLGGRVDRVPVWLPVVPVTVAMMEKARAPWPASHSDPEMMARLAAMPWELTGLPVATVPFCLSLEAEALGCELDWGTINRTPSVKKRAFGRPGEFDVPEGLLERGRIPVALRATEILQEHLGDDIVINAKVTGPFTIAAHVFGVSEFMSWIKTKPELVHEAVSKAGEVTKELSRAFKAHGADTISISDPTSSGDLLSSDYYLEFVFPYHREVAAAIKLPSVLHICGFTKELLPHIRYTGFDAYSFEEKIEVKDAKKALGDDISLIGNIAPVATMLQGTPEKVTAEALKAIQDGIDILSSGCTLSPLTPLENIRALVMAPQKYQTLKEQEEAGRKGGKKKGDVRQSERQRKICPSSILPSREPFKSIAHNVLSGNVDGVIAGVRIALSRNIDPLTIASEGLLKGMNAVSVLYEHKQAYVPEILMAARALDAGLKECGGSIDNIKTKGTVIIHTADGDLHDIGKNIVAAIVAANGYRVADLGTSVESSRVIKAIREHRPIAVLGSSLMTSTRGAFLETADLLKKEGLDVPFIIGGGACDSAFASQRDNIAYLKDPWSVVKMLDSIVGKGSDKPQD